MSELVPASRSYVLEQLTKIPAEEYLEQDVEKLRSDDWFILRFIREKQEDKCKDVIKEAGNAVISCMKFRKSQNIYKIMEGNDFPAELITNGPYQIDESNNYFYLRVKKIKCSKDLMDMYKKYMLYIYETFDQLQTGSKRGKGTFIADLNGSGIQNYDLSIPSYFVQLFLKYYPGITEKLIIVDSTWYLKPPVSIVLALLPDRISKQFLQMNRIDAIREIGGREKTADFMGGSHHFIMKLPSNPVTTSEFIKITGIPEKSVGKLMAYIGK